MVALGLMKSRKLPVSVINSRTQVPVLTNHVVIGTILMHIMFAF